MTNRLRLSVPLVAVFLWIGCIDVPDIVDPPEPPDAGGTVPDGGSTPDGGGAQSPDFELGVSPTEDSVLQGGTKSFQVNLVRKQGFGGIVSIALVNPPLGISAPAVTIPTTGNLGTLNVTVAASVAPGPVALTVRGIAGAVSREQVVSLTVVPLGELAVSWVSPSMSLSSVNGSLSVEVSVEGGQPETVELLKGSTVLTSWTAPPYTYAWDTGGELEGEQLLSARATRGGGTFTSVTRTVVVDRTAPQVATWTPTRGATQVSVHTTVQATFSEPLRASSVMTSNVGLIGNEGVALAASVELSSDGRTLTLTPLSPLPVSSTVSVRLGTTENPLTDLAGNSLVASGVWSFTVPYWLPMGGAISAYPGNTSAENVVMKVGTDGAPVIAWSESDGVTKNIHVARWDGVQWLPLGTALSAMPDSGTHARRPTLSIDGTNAPIIIWEELLPNGIHINLYGRRWTGTEWLSLPEFPALSPSTSAARDRASSAVDGDGKLHVYADFYNGTSNQIAGFNLQPGGTNWADSHASFPSEELQRWNVAVTTYGSSSIFAAYTAIIGSQTSEYRGVTVLKDHWIPIGAPLIFNPDHSTASTPSIKVDGAGNPYVAWVEAPKSSTSGDIFVAHHNGSHWNILGNKPNGSLTSNEAPSLGIDQQGSPVVAWSGFLSPERVVVVSRWDGEQWTRLGPPLSAQSGTSTGGFNPSLAFNAAGHAMVAWHEITEASSDVFVFRHNQ
ncbi:Ig-like domain-containing protein [Myxococcus qinghaiensis]|uniref:Ig-like domain-containing protein n=1 Tax=Myxococcus qinghaiensis TaxID=2906758 RepID=UPI0020A7ADFE|nr:Ig-like domain-containing protein [Myxococcus qinghaiensis]MCP3165540.1 Ig-like domain-containing protein [Myxococcus qinghaiensis]